MWSAGVTRLLFLPPFFARSVSTLEAVAALLQELEGDASVQRGMLSNLKIKVRGVCLRVCDCICLLSDA